jgi:hypothetical protein
VSSKFLIFSKIHAKSETLAMKNVKPTAKKIIFLDTVAALYKALFSARFIQTYTALSFNCRG